MKSSARAIRGFTLIELLVVIAIIGLLSSVVLASLNSARLKSRDARRMADLKQLQIALELYYNSNGSYPATPALYAEGRCAGVPGTLNWVVQPNYTGASAYIPNLAPTHIPTLPGDPSASPSIARCYTYFSDGASYVMWSHAGIEGTVDPNNPLVRIIATACTVYQATFQIASDNNRCH